MKSLIIKEIIEDIIYRYDLNSPSRKKEKCYQRYFLYKYLRTQGFILQDIGLLFNRGHDTILHGLKIYKHLIETKNKGFEKVAIPLAIDLNANLVDDDLIIKDINRVLLNKDCKECFEVLEIVFNCINNTNYKKTYSIYEKLINLKQTK